MNARAVEEFKQLEALAAPLAQKQVGEPSRDLECWGREPQASVSIRLPKEVRPLEVLTLLGDEWQVDESRRGAITTDGVWDAASSLVGYDGKWFTSVVFTRI